MELLVQSCILDLCHQLVLRDIVSNSHRKDTIIHIIKTLSSTCSLWGLQEKFLSIFYNRENWVSFEQVVCICLINMVNSLTSGISVCFGLCGTISARIWTGKQKSLHAFQVWRIIIWRVGVLHNCWKICGLWRLSLLQITIWSSKGSDSQVSVETVMLSHLPLLP